MELDKVETNVKTGNEIFCFRNELLDFHLLDFWKWSYSDLLVNKLRGVLAEFIVAKALDIEVSKTRVEWDDFDLLTINGTSIEVKSASYIQSWEQSKYSNIIFSIKPTEDYKDGKPNGTESRKSDFYIFALLSHKDQHTINPMKLEQWEFYVISTKILNTKLGGQEKISLGIIKKMGITPVDFKKLKYELNSQVENTGA